jgi:hypothetical protein
MNFIPYAPVEKHGVISDRQSAAVIAADGTLSWLCLPRYDGKPIFGTLVDAHRGGYWRMGPKAAVLGEQRYADRTCSLITRWPHEQGNLELTDTMLSPDGKGPRAVVRQLKCTRGVARCAMSIALREDFVPAELSVLGDAAFGYALPSGTTLRLDLFGALALEPSEGALAFTLRQDEMLYAVLTLAGRAPVSADEVRHAVGQSRERARVG